VSATICNDHGFRRPRLKGAAMHAASRRNSHDIESAGRPEETNEEGMSSSVVSEEVHGCGLQAVYNHTVRVTCERPRLAVLLITFQAMSRTGLGNKVTSGTPVAYAAIALGAARPGLRALQLCCPEDGGKIEFATVLCRIEQLPMPATPKHSSEPLSEDIPNKMSARKLDHAASNSAILSAHL